MSINSSGIADNTSFPLLLSVFGVSGIPKDYFGVSAMCIARIGFPSLTNALVSGQAQQNVNPRSYRVGSLPRGATTCAAIFTRANRYGSTLMAYLACFAAPHSIQDPSRATWRGFLISRIVRACHAPDGDVPLLPCQGCQQLKGRPGCPSLHCLEVPFPTEQVIERFHVP